MTRSKPPRASSSAGDVRPRALWWTEATVARNEPRLTIKGEAYEVRAVPFRFAGEDGSSTILTFRNVSQEEELIALSTHDPLTGIFNVRFFDEVLADGAGGTLALVDLDHFKPINDE